MVISLEVNVSNSGQHAYMKLSTEVIKSVAGDASIRISLGPTWVEKAGLVYVASRMRRIFAYITHASNTLTCRYAGQLLSVYKVLSLIAL